MAPSAVQILIVIFFVMVLFGAGRIPTIMENLAKGINSFKKGLKDEEDEKSPPASIEDKRDNKEKSVMNEENKDKSKDV